MRALSLSYVALLGVAAVMVVTPRPGFAQVNHPPTVKEQTVKEVEEVGYRYRRWGYRPYYRPYYGGYYRPYYRPYYGYPYYYRPYYRPWWPGIGFGFWF
jgi:hypothetical protein